MRRAGSEAVAARAAGSRARGPAPEASLSPRGLESACHSAACARGLTRRRARARPARIRGPAIPGPQPGLRDKGAVDSTGGFVGALSATLKYPWSRNIKIRNAPAESKREHLVPGPGRSPKLQKPPELPHFPRPRGHRLPASPDPGGPRPFRGGGQNGF